MDLTLKHSRVEDIERAEKALEFENGIANGLDLLKGDDEMVKQGLSVLKRIIPTMKMIDQAIFEKIMDIFIEKEELSVLKSTIEVEIIMFNQLFERIEDDDIKIIINRSMGLMESDNSLLFVSLSILLKTIALNHHWTSGYMVENGIMYNVSYVLMTGIRIRKKVYYNYSVIVDTAASKCFKSEYLEQIVYFLENLSRWGYDNCLTPYISTLHSLSFRGYPISIESGAKDYLMNSFKSETDTIQLFKLLSLKHSINILETLWGPDFISFMVAACNYYPTNSPEYLFYFLSTIIDFWKPTVDDIVIVLMITVLGIGSFVQKVSVVHYLLKLFPYSNSDYICSMSSNGLLILLSRVLDENNQKICVMVSTVLVIIAESFMISDQDITTISGYSEVCKTFANTELKALLAEELRKDVESYYYLDQF